MQTAAYRPAPTRSPGTGTPPLATAGRPDWQQPLWYCCHDPAACFVSHVLPCVQYGMNQNELDPSRSCVAACLAYTLCPCMIWWTAGQTRTSIREKNNIPGEACEDRCIACVCPCCALVQEYVQLGAQAPQREQMGR